MTQRGQCGGIRRNVTGCVLLERRFSAAAEFVLLCTGSCIPIDVRRRIPDRADVLGRRNFNPE